MRDTINMIKVLWTVRKDERGITALEYGLMAAVVGTAVIALSGKFTTLFGEVFTKLSTTLGKA